MPSFVADVIGETMPLKRRFLPLLKVKPMTTIILEVMLLVLTVMVCLCAMLLAFVHRELVIIRTTLRTEHIQQFAHRQMTRPETSSRPAVKEHRASREQ